MTGQTKSKNSHIRGLHYFQVAVEATMRDRQQGRLQEDMVPYQIIA